MPTDGRLRRALLPGDQRNRPASVGGAPLAGVPLLRRRPAALAQGLLAPRPLHRHGAAEGRSRTRWSGRCRPRPRTRRCKFASPGAADAGRGRRSRPSGRRRSARRPLRRRSRDGRRPRPAKAGRGLRLPLAWLGVVPFFAYASLFLFLPAGQVLVGAFQSADGGFTLANVERSSNEPYRTRSRTSIEVSLVTALAGGDARLPDRVRRRSGTARRGSSAPSSRPSPASPPTSPASRSRSRSSPRSARSGSSRSSSATSASTRTSTASTSSRRRASSSSISTSRSR